MLAPWKTQIGIELTFLPKVVTKEMEEDLWHDNWDALTTQYRDLAKAADLPNSEQIYTDPGCVEYPSPIIKDWKTAKQWYQCATKIGQALDLAPFRENQASGMGHIHIGGRTPTERGKLAEEIIRRPYLGWAFAGPYNQKYCYSVTHTLYSDRHSCYMQKCLRAIRYGDNGATQFYSTIKGMPGFKLRALGTLEWRMFDAAADWEMQEEHIAFIQALVSWVDRTPTEKMTLSEIKDIVNKTKKLDFCIKEFKNFIVNELKLPWHRYEWYVERNLEVYHKEVFKFQLL